MSYRGDDLDLRTPAGAMTAADWAVMSDQAPRAAGRPESLYVDDIVLAIANHAFDIALAHRASDVRIEHLIHALTRNDIASEALEQRGIRVAGLRRDSANIIANEIPVGLANGKGQPRRSEEFAGVLRQASRAASRRNEPADVDDLLFILLDPRNPIPGAGLLTRHVSRATYREGNEQFPPLSRYAPDTRFVPVERYPRPNYEAIRYVAEAPRMPREPRVEPVQSTTDAIQNNRIEALEGMIRGLSNDLASERQTLQSLLRDIGRDTQAQRDDQGRLQSGLYDRLQSLEQTFNDVRLGASGSGVNDTIVDRLHGIESGLERRLQDMTQAWTSLSGRLQDLELAIREGGDASSGLTIDRLRQAIDLQPIGHRLDVIEEAILSRDGQGGSDYGIADRLSNVEKEIARNTATNSGHLARLEKLLSSLSVSGDGSGLSSDQLTPVLDAIDSQTLAQRERLDGMERAITAEIETAAAKHKAYTQDLTEVHDAIMKLNQNQHTLAGSIDQWRTDAAGDVAMISNRLANLDRDNDRPIETLNAMTSHMDTMNRLMVERYHRRNRFWYWLFGTDDWIGRSWPSQAQALEWEKATIKAPSV